MGNHEAGTYERVRIKKKGITNRDIVNRIEIELHGRELNEKEQKNMDDLLSILSVSK